MNKITIRVFYFLLFITAIHQVQAQQINKSRARLAYDFGTALPSGLPNNIDNNPILRFRFVNRKTFCHLQKNLFHHRHWFASADVFYGRIFYKSSNGQCF